MSAQINLYHPRFLKQRDLLTLGNVAFVTAAVYALLAVVGGWAWQTARARTDAATFVESQLKVAKEQVDAATRAAAIRKPSSHLIVELETTEAVLRHRRDIARLLESGVVGSKGGFSDTLRGFARQVPEGLWLTGFTIGAGGDDMEIRGSTLNPAALPDYIRRLGAEKAFQGRNFAALTMNRVAPAPVARNAGQGNAVLPAPTFGPVPVDFVLMPKRAEAKESRQ